MYYVPFPMPIRHLNLLNLSPISDDPTYVEYNGDRTQAEPVLLVCCN